VDTERFFGISFDRDNLLASGSGDRTIQFWNKKTGECIRTLTVQRYGVDSASFEQVGLGIDRSNYGTDIEFLIFLFFIFCINKTVFKLKM